MTTAFQEDYRITLVGENCSIVFEQRNIVENNLKEDLKSNATTLKNFNFFSENWIRC